MEVFILGILTAYGMSALVFLLAAMVTGTLVESVKKAIFGFVEENCPAEKKQDIVTKKAVFSVAFSLILSYLFLMCVIKAMPFPGSDALMPLWFVIFYFTQRVLDLKVVKVIAKAYSNRKARQAKPTLTKTAIKGVYLNEAGQAVDKKGNVLNLQPQV